MSPLTRHHNDNKKLILHLIALERVGRGVRDHSSLFKPRKGRIATAVWHLSCCLHLLALRKVLEDFISSAKLLFWGILSSRAQEELLWGAMCGGKTTFFTQLNWVYHHLFLCRSI